MFWLKKTLMENGEMSGKIGAPEAMMYGREGTLFFSLPFSLSSESMFIIFRIRDWVEEKNVPLSSRKPLIGRNRTELEGSDYSKGSQLS